MIDNKELKIENLDSKLVSLAKNVARKGCI